PPARRPPLRPRRPAGCTRRPPSASPAPSAPSAGLLVVLPDDATADDGHDGGSLEGPSRKRSVAALALEPRRIHFTWPVEGEEGHVGRRARREGASWEPEDARRARREERDQARERDEARTHQAVEAQAHGRLQADDPERGLPGLHLLVVHGVR